MAAEDSQENAGLLQDEQSDGCLSADTRSGRTNFCASRSIVLVIALVALVLAAARAALPKARAQLHGEASAQHLASAGDIVQEYAAGAGVGGSQYAVNAEAYASASRQDPYAQTYPDPSTAQYPYQAPSEVTAQSDAESPVDGLDAYYFTTTTTTEPPPPPTTRYPGQPEDYPGLTESDQKLAFEFIPPSGGCSEGRFLVPSVPPVQATDLNGMSLPDTCFTGPGRTEDSRHHVFLIGDWGGVTHHPWNVSIKGPIPADHRSKMFKGHRNFIFGADDVAQLNVAAQMRKRALKNNPDYILNVGDNFYWGGISIKCGAAPYQTSDLTGQWQEAFESIYTGENIEGKQWLGVLGNHDYGGYMFTAGWDQAIGYTWMQGFPSTGRWVTPALYYASKVIYDDFSVHYYFIDANVWDTKAPKADQKHNICSEKHNPKRGATCGPQGPVSPEECPKWFHRLWDAQMAWLASALPQSTADWQVVVTHYPPEGLWGVKDWQTLADTYGIDLFLTGHRHRQEVIGPDHEHNGVRPSTYIVSGGGGGITSENEPTPDGQDDEYGFVDLTLSRDEIMVEALSHGGQIRSTTCVRPRHLVGYPVSPSLCDGRPSGVQPFTTTSTTTFPRPPMPVATTPPAAAVPPYPQAPVDTPVVAVPQAGPAPPAAASPGPVDRLREALQRVFGR